MQRYNCLLYILFLPTKGRMGCLDIIPHQHFHLVNFYTNSKNDIGMCNSE